MIENNIVHNDIGSKYMEKILSVSSDDKYACSLHLAPLLGEEEQSVEATR